MKVLIVKTSSMGDVIHALPALSDAAKHLNVRFDWVVEKSFCEIPRWHSAVDRVIEISLRTWKKNLTKKQSYAELSQFISELRQESYDHVVDLQGLLKSAWIGVAAKTQQRCGYDKHSARESIASYFYQQQSSVSKQLHAVERNRQLLASSLGYSIDNTPLAYDLSIPSGEMPVVLESDKKTLMFFHGTSRDDKCWPEQYWRELAESFAEKQTQILLPWGSKEEQQRAQRIANGLPHVQVLERLSLSELAQLIQQVDAAVSVDTGLGHLAAALSCHNVALYGPTSIDLVGSYGLNQQHLVAPDGAMVSISVAQVIDALQCI